MKRTCFVVILLTAIFAIPAAAQEQGHDRDDRQAHSNHRVKNEKANGWIRKEGDNYFFENDKDHQRYRIQNSEAVREHEGHHVTLNGRLHEDDHSFEVNKVKRLKEKNHDNDRDRH